MTDLEKISMIREAMPATKNSAYFNTGSIGPLSKITSEAIRRSDTMELIEGRANLTSMHGFRQTMEDLRMVFADFVNASTAEIAVTHHTTDGMNIVTHGLGWQAGDEIITTNLEHPGGLLPLYVLRQRFGVVVKVVDIPAKLSAEQVVQRLEAAITPRTRLLALSHVAWNTGMRLPFAEIAAMGHRHHVLSLFDGAQAAGAIPLDLPASGVDFYALPGQKWLCGPEGMGALYIRKENINLVAPTFVGYRSMDPIGGHDWTGYYMPPPDARRYELATRYKPSSIAMLANLVWLRDEVGWAWIYARVAALAEYARQILATLPGVTVVSPPDRAGLVTFMLDHYDPARVMLKLSEDKIILRTIPDPYTLRISTGFYNTEGDIDRLAAALQAIQKIDPELLPEPNW